jgi:hypothetical protein
MQSARRVTFQRALLAQGTGSGAERRVAQIVSVLCLAHTRQTLGHANQLCVAPTRGMCDPEQSPGLRPVK